MSRLKPTDLGLFDTYGNLWQWCQDRWLLYPEDQVTEDEEDGAAVIDKDRRVMRGSFSDLPSCLRSACRDGNRPTNRFIGVGVRVARAHH